MGKPTGLAKDQRRALDRLKLVEQAMDRRIMAAMLTFLFWNLKGKPEKQTLSRLAMRHEIDVMMLAECSLDPATVLGELNQKIARSFHYSESLGSDIRIYSRFKKSLIAPVHEEFGLTVRRLKLPARVELTLVVAHLSSKLYQREGSQVMESAEIARTIRDVEKRLGHRRTVLVGDLNMNPFEDGVAGSVGLNAVMDRAIAERGSRVVKGRDYPFFYNPMWSRFGDSTPGRPGTYYRDGAEHVTFFWNMYDQVLIRPELLEHFCSDDLRILDTDGTRSFLTKHARPDKVSFSDHLPILFQLSL